MLKKMVEKLKNRSGNLYGEPITIAFLGDSVTQGCFEIYHYDEKSLQTVFDSENSFAYYVRRILAVLFPNVAINVINAGISGDNAVSGSERIDRCVLKFSPDIVVVGYGLNDCDFSDDALTRYLSALNVIFKKINKSGAEGIYLTPNRMNSRISPLLEKTDLMLSVAERCKCLQEGGYLAKFCNEGKKIAEINKTAVCDIYTYWDKIEESGANTTELLANKINHPIKQMNWLTAEKIVETILV